MHREIQVGKEKKTEKRKKNIFRGSINNYFILSNTEKNPTSCFWKEHYEQLEA